MTAPPLGLGRSDISALGRSAADVSARGQRLTKWLVRAELIALILAASAGVVSLRVGPLGLDVMAALAGVFFVVSLLCLTYRSLSRPEGDWYSGRAAAESVRTLAWRYAVGGHPFPGTLPESDAAELFLARLAAILRELKETKLTSSAPTDSELTPAMKSLRRASFDVRRAAYQRDRIQDQITWYTKRADTHQRAADRWLLAAGAASVLGLVAAGLRVFGIINSDLLGVAAACASAAIAWNS